MRANHLRGTNTKSTDRNPQTFGEIRGYPVGSTFKDRKECSDAGVHAHLRAGIHGSEDDGAYSICLSGGYADDSDQGEWLVYTGEGGRNLNGDKLDRMMGKKKWSGEQNADQQWVRGNKALKTSMANKKPVRVIRGAGHTGRPSKFAPWQGYRYDGLYLVEKAKRVVGEGGFKTCRFLMSRLPNQLPPPWITSGPKNEGATAGPSHAKPPAATPQSFNAATGPSRQRLAAPPLSSDLLAATFAVTPDRMSEPASPPTNELSNMTRAPKRTYEEVEGSDDNDE